MWFLGHMALGYYSGFIVSKFTKEKLNIPFIWFISLAPDLDIIFPFILHRGPTHSILIASVVFLSFFFKYKKGLVYFASLISHSLIGGYVIGNGDELLQKEKCEFLMRSKV